MDIENDKSIVKVEVEEEEYCYIIIINYFGSVDINCVLEIRVLICFLFVVFNHIFGVDLCWCMLVEYLLVIVCYH